MTFRPPGTFELFARVRRQRIPIPFDALNAHLDVLEPVRKFHVSRKSKHMPGKWFSSSTGTHIPYESLLERSSLLQIDFEGSATHIVAQPFQLVYRVEGKTRSHVPDFLVKLKDGALALIDVKRASETLKPKVIQQLGYCSEFCAGTGLSYRIMTEADPQHLENLRWLSGYRDPDLLEGPEFATAISLLAEGPRSFGDLIASAEVPCLARPAVFAGLWAGLLVSDLSSPLNSETEIRRGNADESHGNDGNGLARPSAG